MDHYPEDSTSHPANWLWMYLHTNWNAGYETVRVAVVGLTALTALMGAKAGIEYAFMDSTDRDRAAQERAATLAHQTHLRQEAASQALTRPDALRALGACPAALMLKAGRAQQKERMGLLARPSAGDYQAAVTLAETHHIPCTPDKDASFSIRVANETVVLLPSHI